MCLLESGQLLLLSFLCDRAEDSKTQVLGQDPYSKPWVYEKQIDSLPVSESDSLHFQGKPWHFISGQFEACPLQNKEEKGERNGSQFKSFLSRQTEQVWFQATAIK